MYSNYSDMYDDFKNNGITTPIFFRKQVDMSKEEYRMIEDKHIPGIVPGRYMISNYGNFYDNKRGKILEGSFDKDGYRRVSVSLKNGYSVSRVHRTELMVFDYNPDHENLQVNHIDGNVNNNMLSNLEWTTPKENSDHAMIKGLHKMHGEDNPLAKLSETDVHEICKLIETGNYYDTEIAKMYNVSYTNISDIHKGKLWKNVSRHYDLSKRKSRKQSQQYLIKFVDVLNILLILNKAFFERAYVVFNPRNAFYISKIDGKLNNDVMVQRDTVINANTFMYLGRDNYNEERMNKIKKIQEKQKLFYLNDSVFEKV